MGKKSENLSRQSEKMSEIGLAKVENCLINLNHGFFPDIFYYFLTFFHPETKNLENFKNFQTFERKTILPGTLDLISNFVN